MQRSQVREQGKRFRLVAPQREKYLSGGRSVGQRFIDGNGQGRVRVQFQKILAALRYHRGNRGFEMNRLTDIAPPIVRV